MVPVSSSRPAILGATILLGAVFTFSALIGRCGLMDLVVESAAPEHGRRGWFGRAQVPAGVALTFECELGYTFDPAVWGQGFATEAVRWVRDYARDVLLLSYAISAILPQIRRCSSARRASDSRRWRSSPTKAMRWILSYRRPGRRGRRRAIRF